MFYSCMIFSRVRSDQIVKQINDVHRELYYILENQRLQEEINTNIIRKIQILFYDRLSWCAEIYQVIMVLIHLHECTEFPQQSLSLSVMIQSQYEYSFKVGCHSDSEESIASW